MLRVGIVVEDRDRQVRSVRVDRHGADELLALDVRAQHDHAVHALASGMSATFPPQPDEDARPDRHHDRDQRRDERHRPRNRRLARQQDGDEGSERSHSGHGAHVDGLVHAADRVPAAVQLKRSGAQQMRDEGDGQDHGRHAHVNERHIPLVPQPRADQQADRHTVQPCSPSP